MNGSGGARWYLIELSKKLGPYTTDEVLSLLEKGQMQLGSTLQSEHDETSISTVREILQPRLDPAYSLVDTLHMAKTRNANKPHQLISSHFEQAGAPPLSSPFNQMGKKIGIAALLLATGIWIWFLSSQNNSHPLQSSSKTPTDAPEAPSPVILPRSAPSSRVIVPPRPIYTPFAPADPIIEESPSEPDRTEDAQVHNPPETPPLNEAQDNGAPIDTPSAEPSP